MGCRLHGLVGTWRLRPCRVRQLASNRRLLSASGGPFLMHEGCLRKSRRTMNPVPFQMMAYLPSDETLERFLYVQFETEVCHPGSKPSAVRAVDHRHLRLLWSAGACTNADDNCIVLSSTTSTADAMRASPTHRTSPNWHASRHGIQSSGQVGAFGIG